MQVRIKTEGEWQDKEMEGEELFCWFTEHTKDGIVTDEIQLFSETILKQNKDNTVDWVMSDMSLDRDFERVNPDGCNMKNYKKNPVVLWGHDHSRPAIGACVKGPKCNDGKITGGIAFDNKDNDPFAGMIAGKVRAGIIKSGSIGFKPNKVEFVDDSKDPTRMIHQEWELLEFSICNVPANANARVSGPTDGMMDSEADILKDKEIATLKAKIVELERQPKSYVDELFKDRGKPSHDKSESKTVDGSIESIFVPRETSVEEDNDTLKELLEG